ncbi:MAG TPA: hypothetical protein VF509_10655 [Sphingobium sp.]
MQISTIPTLRIMIAGCLILASNHGIQSASAQSAAATTSAPIFSYADYADLAVAAPVVAKAQITQATALGSRQATGVPAGFKRFYVEAKVIGLIRGDNGISPTISYLYDAPLDRKGKAPKLKKRQVLIFTRPGAKTGQLQLVARDAQIDWTPTADSSVKSVVSELLGQNVPPHIVGVGDAFHVAGTIAGEGETQIFLKTQDGQPVSLSIISRPGQQPQWAVALGEVVDEAAAAPRRGTLLWYRLACDLPAELPAASTRTLGAIDAEAARRDYAVVLAGLGQCGRTRKPA